MRPGQIVFVFRTWPLLVSGLFAWAVFPWLWRRIGLPYDDLVAKEDSVAAQQYNGIYIRALPKLRRLWVLGGATAIFDYALEVLFWQSSDWVTATAVPFLRIVAALLIGTAIAQALELVFREVSMAVKLLQRDYVISESPRLVTLLCILLQHSTVLVGLSLVVTSVFLKYVGITTDTIVGVAGSLIASRYIGFIGRDIDITETRASRQEEIA